MKTALALLHTTRERVYSLVASMEWDEVNTVPKGFSNSISWNLGHILVTQQLLHYKLSGHTMLLSEDFVDKYRKGTKHENEISQDDWNTCLVLLKSLAEELENDYYTGKFVQFQQYPTSYGYELNNIDEAIHFNNVHEALHLGYMMSMRNVLRSK